MEVLPLGADVDLANSVTQSNAGDELRRTYGISPDATVIFSGGKLVPMKRTEILVDAFRTLPSGNIRLVIAGDAPRGDPYKRVLLDRAAGDDRIRFVGWLTPLDIYRHLDLADIAVFPGSQSILWQQAISMGLPLIVGTMNGRQDVTYLNKYGNILVADSMKPLAEGVCDALSQLVGDDELRARMAEGARRVRAELLDWNKLIHRTLRFNGPADASKSTDPGIHETGNLRT
jgi:glycosyltransferase involved in cell wall biosynthesis